MPIAAHAARLSIPGVVVGRIAAARAERVSVESLRSGRFRKRPLVRIALLPRQIMSMPGKTRVLILGGGFGGLYAALQFEKRRDSRFEVTVVNRENFFLFTPMLHEIAASDLDLTNIVNPVRKMIRHVNFFCGDVEQIDLEKKQVVVSHGFDRHSHTLEYDHLVLALGSVTNFFNLPGVAERALTMKSLGDAIQLRNRLIAHLEEADTECARAERPPLLTFVVAGGGFAGVETIASINDFLRDALPFYPNLKEDMLRLVLVHPGEYILPELGEKLGRYADRKLRERGVEIRAKSKVAAVRPNEIELSDGEKIVSSTLVWTAGISPNPILDRCGVRERTRPHQGEC